MRPRCNPQQTIHDSDITSSVCVHTMLVIGGRDLEAGNASVRLHHGGPQGAKPKAEVVADILAVIREQRA